MLRHKLKILGNVTAWAVCLVFEGSSSDMRHLSLETQKFLFGILLAFMVFGTVMAFSIREPERSDGEEINIAQFSVKKTLSFAQQEKAIWLLALLFYTGLEQAFIWYKQYGSELDMHFA